MRRIERVALKERIVAMTFDDGPCALPANPPADGDKPLTLCILETLERYGALGTFDVVGGHIEKLPPTLSAGRARRRGAALNSTTIPISKRTPSAALSHAPSLPKRILDGGHEITSHSWAHVLFEAKAAGLRQARPS